MLLETEPDVLFQCDVCEGTISPSAPLMVDNGYHYCGPTCYINRPKSHLARGIAEEVYNALKSSYIKVD